MSEYILSCCSTADLDNETMQRRNIQYVCNSYVLNGVTMKDDLGQSLTHEQFYAIVKKGAETATSQVNVDEFIRYFTPFLEDGKDILHVCLSSGITGGINSARIAREELLERFPQRKILILDSLAASSGYGMLMDTLADLRDEGKTMEELAQFVEERRLHLHHWLYSTDLSMYVKGGRISATAGMVGSMLHICPVLDVNSSGKLIPRHKCRGKNKAAREIVRQMEEHAENGLNYDGKCFIAHADCPEEAQALSEMVCEKFQHLKEKPKIFYIGTTIGSHSGAGTLAVFFWGDLRTE